MVLQNSSTVPHKGHATKLQHCASQRVGSLSEHKAQIDHAIEAPSSLKTVVVIRSYVRKDRTFHKAGAAAGAGAAPPTLHGEHNIDIATVNTTLTLHGEHNIAR